MKLIRIYRTHECPAYDTKSDSGASIMLDLWGMLSTSSLPSHPGQLWPIVVVPDRVLSMGQIELIFKEEELDI